MPCYHNMAGKPREHIGVRGLVFDILILKRNGPCIELDEPKVPSNIMWGRQATQAIGSDFLHARIGAFMRQVTFGMSCTGGSSAACPLSLFVAACAFGEHKGI